MNTLIILIGAALIAWNVDPSHPYSAMGLVVGGALLAIGSSGRRLTLN